MAKDNIVATSSKTNEELLQIYREAKSELGFNHPDLDAIFHVVLLDKETLFPNQKKDTEKECIKQWIGRYKASIENPPSKHIGQPKKTCTDPSLAKIVKSVRGLTDDEISAFEKNHNLFMAAENIQGDLLEEYIAKNVAPHNWIWCAGNTLRAVDFCKRDGSSLLQVKNKDNTENSSSNKIRNGTEIKKANRLKTRTKNKKPYADYEWEKINRIINEGSSDGIAPCKMSEEEYQYFLDEVVNGNPNIISEE